jgi:hypothetical protein
LKAEGEEGFGGRKARGGTSNSRFDGHHQVGLGFELDCRRRDVVVLKQRGERVKEAEDIISSETNSLC